MMKYYSFGDKIKRNTAFICAIGETPIAHRLIEGLNGVNKIPFVLLLKSISFGKNGSKDSTDLSRIEHLWTDFAPNEFAWPFMSEKMKQIVERHLTGNEHIDWISADVKGVV